MNTRIADLDQHVGQTVSGHYRVLDARRRLWDRPDKPSLELTIADATGSARCEGTISASALLLNGDDDNVIVQVQGEVAATELDTALIRAVHCTPVDLTNHASWHLLPRCWVPEPAQLAFDRLLTLLDSLDNAPLRSFMSRLLADRTIAEPFLCVPGSRTHHHARPGGLLAHSVECAEAAADAGKRFLPDHEAALAVVGALLHDIAKIRILVAPISDWQPIYGVTHEALDLEVLAPFLRELDASWPDGGAALREVLAPARSYGVGRGWAPLLLTDLVRYIDHLSAGADLRQERFRHRPADDRCTRTEHGQLLVRVRPPEPEHPKAHGRAAA